MSKTWVIGSAAIGLAVSAVACANDTDEGASSTGEAITAEQRARCEADARQYSEQFLLPWRRQQAYQQRLSDCVRAADGDYTDENELPLVRRRTQIAADIAARHLATLPASVKEQARCISVISKDTIGWGLSGGGIGAGLVSCVTSDGRWSAPSYLSLTSFDLGPSVGFLDEDTTFVFTRTDMYKAFRNDFDFEAGVYATAGSAHVQLSADTDGCITADVFGEHQRNCTIAITDRVGLHAGAKVSGILVRHMQGLLGGGHIGRNAKVYGSGITVNKILTTPGDDIGSNVIQPWMSALDTAGVGP